MYSFGANIGRPNSLHFSQSSNDAQKESLLSKAAESIIEDNLKSDTVIYKLNRKNLYRFHVIVADAKNVTSEVDLERILKPKLEKYIENEMNCQLTEFLTVRFFGKGNNWKIYLSIQKSSLEKLKLPQSQEVAQQAQLIAQLQNIILKKNETIATQERRLSTLNAKIAALESTSSLSIQNNSQTSMNTEQEEMIQQLLDTCTEQSAKIAKLEQQLGGNSVQMQSQMESVTALLKERESQLSDNEVLINYLEKENTTNKQLLKEKQSALEEISKTAEIQKRSLTDISSTVESIIKNFSCPIDFEIFSDGAYITPSGRTYNASSIEHIKTHGKDFITRLPAAPQPDQGKPPVVNQVYTNRIVIETAPYIEQLQKQIAEALPKEEKQ